MTASVELTGIAKRVHDDIMALPDEAGRLYAAMIISGGINQDLKDHHGVIQNHLDKVIDKRISRISNSIAKSVISKRGEGTETLVAFREVIAKAGFDFLTPDMRRQYVHRQQRDSRGRFKVEHQKIINRSTKHPLPKKAAKEWRIKGGESLGSKEKAAYQSAYIQVANLLDRHYGAGNDGVIHLTYRAKNGVRQEETMDLEKPGIFKLNEDRFKNGGKLIEAEVALNDPPLTAQGAAFDLASTFSPRPAASRFGAAFGTDENGIYRGQPGAQEFQRDWNSEIDPNNPSARIFSRLHAGSRLLTSAVGDQAGGKIKLALSTGEFVSQYGPEAQKVIGPHADRAAYRYRGVERKPDINMLASVNRVQRVFENKPGAARNALIYGYDEPQARRPGEAPRSIQRSSPLIAYFQKRLPDAELTELQRKSGVIPPSEGVILNKKGQVITQAVGYGDDWYLPFNLKTLSKAKGGDYIRTRTWGGPTTEDIYAGLMAGVNSVTVVSHNGVYTIEFDDSFRGTRRYNDKAARMVKRYGHLLDAVKSREVTLQRIPDSRNNELKALAAAEASERYEPEQYKKELNRLRNLETKEPQMSAADKQAFAQAWLDDYAAQNNDTGKADWTTLASQYVERQVSDARRGAQGYTDFDEDYWKNSASQQVSDPDRAIATLGLGANYEKALENHEAEYRAMQSPLNLDGAGYKKSMDALREQFPYYIKKVEWKQPRSGGFDFGYVKPKFNRPAGVLSGYFDPTISGSPTGAEKNKSNGVTGKITADRTRFQNIGVKRVTEESETEKNKDSTGAIKPDRRTPEQKAAEQYENVKELRNQLKSSVASFDGQGGVPVILANSPAAMDHLKKEYPVLMDDSRFDQLNPAQAKAEVIAAYDKLKLDPMVNPKVYPQSIYEKVKNPDKDKKGDAYNMVSAVSNKSKLYDFGEGFEVDHQPNHYSDRGQLILNTLGPDLSFDDENLDSKLNVLIDQNYQNYLHAGMGSVPNVPQVFENNVKKAFQVKALKIRHSEALAKEEKDSRENLPNIGILDMRGNGMTQEEALKELENRILRQAGLNPDETEEK